MEILGDRWTLLIVREMLFDVCRFNDLERCLPGISRSVLAQRLRHLERAGLLTRHVGASGRSVEYRLTAAGWALRPVVHAIGEWAAAYASADPRPEEPDADLLMRWISRHLNAEALPASRVVIQFDFTAPRQCRFWLVLEPQAPSICLEEPGFDVDVRVTCSTEVLYRIYLGKISLGAAMRADDLQLAGTRPLLRAFPNWFAWSRFASAVRAPDTGGRPHAGAHV
ncbi:winged helix-turn-helix transcriptional regulator [Streptomyces sp. YIM S03343]